MDWSFSLATTGGVPITAITAARQRRVTWRLDGPAEASFEIDGRHPEALEVAELTTDLLVHWRGQLLFRGRVGATSDEVGPDDHRLQVSAVDYRGLLERRIVPADRSWTATDLTDIAWAMIQASQGQVGGDLGITRGRTEATRSVDWEVPAGKRVAEAIDDLAKQWPGFDWQISPTLEFDTWGFRGAQQDDWAVDHGGTATSVQRAVDPGEFANHVRASGADGVPAATRTASNIGTRPEGRWETQVGNPDLATADAVAQHAEQTLHRMGGLLPAYRFRLRSGAWTPDDAWVGDIVRYHVRSGRLDVHDAERIAEITVTVDADGTDEVDIGVGELRGDLLVWLRQAPARLEQLSRR